jgi:hypothetical protein
VLLEILEMYQLYHYLKRGEDLSVLMLDLVLFGLVPFEQEEIGQYQESFDYFLHILSFAQLVHLQGAQVQVFDLLLMLLLYQLPSILHILSYLQTIK